MGKKKNETSGYENLMNLKTKPSDFRPGFHEQQMTIDDLMKRKSDLDYYVREFDVAKNSLNAKLGSLDYYIARRTDPLARNLYGCLRDIEVMTACLMGVIQEVRKKGVNEINEVEKFIDDFL